MVLSENIPTYDEVREALQLASDKSFTHWYNHDLFTWKWWMLLSALFLPWLIWWRTVDRKRLPELFQLGLLWSVVSIVLDVSGVNLNLWSYPDRLVWFIPPLIPADLSVIPVTYMLSFQLFREGKSFVIANLILAASFSFVIEPLFTWLGTFEIDRWSHLYSFICFTLLGFLIRWIVLYIKSKTKTAGT